MLRRSFVVLALGLAVGLIAATGTSNANPGSHEDPRDAENSSLDIREISHSSTISQVTYEADMWWPESLGKAAYDPYEDHPAEPLDITWSLDFNDDGSADVIVSADVSDPGDLRGEVRSGDGTVVGPATVTRPDAWIFRVVWDRSTLDAIPEAQAEPSYRYFVVARSDNSQSVEQQPTGIETDRAPDAGFVMHEFAQAPATPAPTPATPAPTPTPAPVVTPTPTPAATPTPTRTQTEGAVSTAVVTPGQTVTISGGGFAPHATLEVIFQSDPIILGTTTADGNGRYSAAVRIPQEAPAGRHTITVRGPNEAGGLHESVREVRVQSPVRLPQTGGSIATLVIAGLAAITAGEFLIAGRLFVTRRRRGIPD